MQLIERLPRGSRVLDLGAFHGSFHCDRDDLLIVRLDLEVPKDRAPGWYVAGDAARMPFRSESFDLIVSNHSLEHFPELQATVLEIGRVVRPEGALYVAVPDAGTLTDHIYRWLGKGGGHVNAFHRPEDVTGLVAKLTRLPHRGTQVLYSSLSFLNQHNFATRPPRKIALFAFGNERFLARLVWMLRQIDRRCGTRWGHYGWAFYFGSADVSAHLEAYENVCVRCGSGHDVTYLSAMEAIRGGRYLCPVCGASNWLL